MISFSKLGQHGRLGNQLFQIASTIGIADTGKKQVVFPSWEYSTFFNTPFPIGECSGTTVNEVKFEYDPEIYERVSYQSVKGGRQNNVDLFGYFQSYKYWHDSEAHIKNTFRFKEEFINQQRRKYYKAFEKKTIAIHIRRGDYLNNPNYIVLPITYYILALFKHFPDWENHNIIIFGDNMPYCKVHFDCLPNVFFSEGNSDIEDLCLMSECDHFILSNSSYSWWGAYLGQNKNSIVVRPKEYYKGEMAKSCDTKDFWPKKWNSFSSVGLKLDLSDVTFTIPVAFDHKDRQKNLELCVCMLQSYFDTNIIVGEQGGEYFRYMKKFADYMLWPGMRNFHRTKMLNDMAVISDTKYVANWDADIVLAPLQLYIAVLELRNGAEVVYPYKWMFARIPRLPWFQKLEKALDIGIVGDTKFNGMNNGDAISYGGAVLFNKKTFFKYGGENEKFVSFGPEDSERYNRFKTIGAKIVRVLGPLYHINHFVGNNSSNRHPFVASNRQEHEKILRMDKGSLLAYIKTWSWIKNLS